MISYTLYYHKNGDGTFEQDTVIDGQAVKLANFVPRKDAPLPRPCWYPHDVYGWLHFEKAVRK